MAAVDVVPDEDVQLLSTQTNEQASLENISGLGDITLFRETINAARMTEIFDLVHCDSVAETFPEGMVISFVGCVLDEPAQMVLGTRMRASTRIKKLYINPRGEIEAFLCPGVIASICACTSLRHLTITTVGSIGISELAKFIGGSSIEHLHWRMQDDVYHWDDRRLVCDALSSMRVETLTISILAGMPPGCRSSCVDSIFQGMTSQQTIRSLEIVNGRCVSGAAACIALNSTLRSLVFGEADISPTDMDELARAMEANDTLTHLEYDLISIPQMAPHAHEKYLRDVGTIKDSLVRNAPGRRVKSARKC